MYFKIDAGVSDEQKEELIRMAQKYSPLFNSTANPVQVSVQLGKSGDNVNAVTVTDRVIACDTHKETSPICKR